MKMLSFILVLLLGGFMPAGNLLASDKEQNPHYITVKNSRDLQAYFRYAPDRPIVIRNHRPDNYRERKGFRLHLCRTATIQSGGPKRQRDSLQNSNFKRMPGMEQRQNNPEFGYQGCTFRSYG